MKERELLEAIYKQNPGAVLFRNDCGSAWVGGTSKRLSDGRLVLTGAQKISYGLMKGSADLIGWTPTVVTREMIGQTIAVFTSIEAKTENDSLRYDQVNWARQVRDDGGIAQIVRERGGQLGLEGF